ncbi:MAG: glycine cleavage system aminomethyltransferase GcvT [Alicyclobacillus sp.]|nr:glycine cleavage system aminomethyltransferase GcvT [Alicyclobacillus sp.]
MAVRPYIRWCDGRTHLGWTLSVAVCGVDLARNIAGGRPKWKEGAPLAGLKRTPLYPVYERYGAKTVDFGGFEMPVQFSSILAEHEAVRTSAGLFDVSHMGEFEVTGAGARAFLQRLVTNDLSRLEPGSAMYSPMTYEHGGTVDDLLVYCFSDTRFWTVVNAGNIHKDWEWMNAALRADEPVSLVNRSDEIALLALQGPKAQAILQPLTPLALAELPYYRFAEATVVGHPAVVSRTGYTGEDGFELYVGAKDAEDVWQRILDQGQDTVKPCGLGARDTLRLEARLPLYGHELTDDVNPLEAGLGPFVKLEAGPFIGRAALAQAKADGLKRRIVGFRLLERGIPRQGYPVWADGRVVGQVTSGTMSPTLHEPIGLALVDAAFAKVGTALSVEIRGRQSAAEVVKTPFYRRAK